MTIENDIDVTIDYKRYLSEHKVTSSRERSNVMYRNAYSVALLDYYGPSECARITNRDHSTIIYSRKMHETNMAFDSTYIKAYQHCKGRLARVISTSAYVEHPLAPYSRLDLYDMIEKKDQEILELKYQVQRAKEYRQQQEAIQGVF